MGANSFFFFFKHTIFHIIYKSHYEKRNMTFKRECGLKVLLVMQNIDLLTKAFLNMV